MIRLEYRANMYFDKEDVLHIYNCIPTIEAVWDDEEWKICPRHREAQVYYLRLEVLNLPFSLWYRGRMELEHQGVTVLKEF